MDTLGRGGRPALLRDIIELISGFRRGPRNWTGSGIFHWGLVWQENIVELNVHYTGNGEWPCGEFPRQ